MRASRWWLLAGVVVAAGCGGDADTTDDLAGDTALAPTMGPAPADTTAIASDTGAMGGGSHVTLNPVPDSPAAGAAGMAMLTPRGTDMEVSLSVTGAQPSTTLPAHIHRGRCGNDQGVAAPLGEITSGADGSGNSTATVPAGDLSGEHFVQVHGAGGAPILCADLPAS